MQRTTKQAQEQLKRDEQREDGQEAGAAGGVGAAGAGRGLFLLICNALWTLFLVLAALAAHSPSPVNPRLHCCTTPRLQFSAFDFGPTPPRTVAPCLIMHMPPMMCVLFSIYFRQPTPSSPSPPPHNQFPPFVVYVLACTRTSDLLPLPFFDRLFFLISPPLFSLSLFCPQARRKNNCQKNITQKSPHYSRLQCAHSAHSAHCAARCAKGLLKRRQPQAICNGKLHPTSSCSHSYQANAGCTCRVRLRMNETSTDPIKYTQECPIL